MSVEGPILALDYGTVRIGMAVSDAEAVFAFPAGTLTSRGRERDLAALREVIAERGIRRIVVGLPVHLDGRRGDTARAAEKFANAVAEGTGLPVEMLDERWTTREAERALRDAGRSGKQMRGSVDAAAAALLLRTWLERANAGGSAE
ncbi:MAG: Holliday junction resolvase RuvX [Myxococcota bacterium]